MDTEGHMLKRLALVVSVLVVFTFGVTGCDSGSKDTNKGHENMPGMKQ